MYDKPTVCERNKMSSDIVQIASWDREGAGDDVAPLHYHHALSNRYLIRHVLVNKHA